MSMTTEEMIAQGKRFERARKEGRVVKYAGYEVIADPQIALDRLMDFETPMVEKVARAISDCISVENHYPPLSDAHWKVFLAGDSAGFRSISAQANAAIKAMLDPSKAVFHAANIEYEHCREQNAWPGVKVYQAALTAALKP